MVFGKNPGSLAFFNFHGGPHKMAQVNITGSLRATEKNKIGVGTNPKSASVFLSVYKNLSKFMKTFLVLELKMNLR